MSPRAAVSECPLVAALWVLQLITAVCTQMMHSSGRMQLDRPLLFAPLAQAASRRRGTLFQLGGSGGKRRLEQIPQAVHQGALAVPAGCAAPPPAGIEPMTINYGAHALPAELRRP